MSLDNPVWYEKVIAKIFGIYDGWIAFKYKRVVIYSLLGLILFTFVLFVMDRCDASRKQAQIDKARRAVNVAMQDLANVKSDINADKDKASQAVANLQVATNTYLDSVNAATEARNATNEALSNVSRAVNANRPANVAISDVEKQLDNLNIQ